MKLKLYELTIKDFAGIKEESFQFDGKDAKIFGDNATGKTTTAVAINWLLFDKGLEGQKIDIVPKDEHNHHIHERVPTVSAVFDMDGNQIKLQRESHPNYEKVEGSTKKHYKNSRTNKQYIDDVPFAVTKYKTEINKIIDEEVFKLVTNPDAFPQLHWQDKRKMLFEIAGGVSDIQVIESSKELKPLLDIIGKREIEDHKKVIKEQLSRAKENLEHIPVKINTLNDQLQEESSNLKVDEVLQEIERLEGKLSVLEEKKSEARNGGATLDIKRQISDKQYEMDTLKRDIEGSSKDKKNGLQREVPFFESDIDIFKGQKQRTERDIEDLVTSKERALEEYRELKKERDAVEIQKFKADVDDTCPTCGQPLQKYKVQEAREHAEAEFNQKKSRKLEQLNQDLERKVNSGKSIAQSIEVNKSKIADLDGKISNTQQEIEKVQKQLEKVTGDDVRAEDDDRYKALQSDIEVLQAKLGDEEEAVKEWVADIEASVQKIQTDLGKQREALASHKATERLKGSIEEYHQEEERLLDLIEKLKYDQYLLDEFTKTKVNLITEKVNQMFDLARFKLFHQQVNGDIKETCEIMVDGVTYDGGLNNAARINVGLDIVETLSNHFNVEAPIFIDNSESVTQLKEVPAQQIQLIVSEQDDKLKLKTEL
ncbi:AAA family ATPase [Salinicoccus sesuvii]|uniref:Nuclease SbcCD subunit C n=1 Tax=Salinicoccus sesuvii TaxID=868281 RepID=A0ABV7N3D6_9STAP